MRLSQRTWAELGKALLLIVGLTLLRAAHLLAAQEQPLLLLLWLGSLGLGCIAVAFRAMLWTPRK